MSLPQFSQLVSVVILLVILERPVSLQETPLHVGASGVLLPPQPEE